MSKAKQWCEHIKMLDGVWTSQRWRMMAKRDAWRGDFENNIRINVPRSWRVCPICEALRPSRSNIKSARLRAEMDSDL